MALLLTSRRASLSMFPGLILLALKDEGCLFLNVFFIWEDEKGLWDFSAGARGLSGLIEKIGESAGIREPSRFVNPAPRR